jgi:predicted chitinase
MPGLGRGQATADLIPMETAMAEFDIKSELRSAMWLAQVGHESGSLRYMEEIASGSAYEGRRDLGNTQPGDGVRFKGRGPIQLTGRSNYHAAGDALHLDLVGNPALAADPAVAFRMSAWWWFTHGLNPIADAGDVVAATRRINGGLNGLADRQRRYQIARSLGAAVIVTGGAAAPPQAKRKGRKMIAATPSGDGYYTVTPDGALYAFGDAVFKGGPNSPKVLQPGVEIIGIAVAHKDGYWLYGSDGSIFAYGSAQFHGRPDRAA